jgi:hypothetical protein
VGEQEDSGRGWVGLVHGLFCGTPLPPLR